MSKSFDLSVIFRVVDKITKPIQKIGRATDKLKKPFNNFEKASRLAFSRVDVGLRKLERRFKQTADRINRSGFTKIGNRMKDVGSQMTMRASLPLAIFGGLAIKAATDFQKSMNMVGAVTKATEEEFKKLRDLAKEQGATTQFSASQAAEGMKFLGMAGLTVNEIFGALPKTLELAASAQIDLGTAADIVTNIMSGYRMETSELSRANDVLVNAFTSSNTDLQQLGEAMKVVGPVAKAMEFRFTETAAALGILAKNAFQGGLGGTGLRRIMTNLVSPTKKAKDALDDIGVQFLNTDGTLRDLSEILIEFEKAQARNVDQMVITQTVMETFGQRGGPQFLALLGAGSEELKKFEKNLHEVGTASRISEAQMKGLPGAFKLLISSFEAIQLAITDSGFGKFVENIARNISGFFQELSKTNPKLIAFATIIATIIGLAGPLIIALGAVSASLGVLGIAASPFLVTIASIAAAITGLILLVKLYNGMTLKVKKTDEFSDIGNDEVVRSKVNWGGNSTKDLISQGTNKSQTDINLKVTTDSGSNVTTEKINAKKGNANVNIATVGYVGGFY